MSAPRDGVMTTPGNLPAAPHHAPIAPVVALAAEDPGAAAFLAGVMACAPPGLSMRLGACGHAARWFDAESLPFEHIDVLLEPRPRVLAAGTGEDPDGPVMRLLRTAQAQGVVTVAIVDAEIAVLDRFRPSGDSTARWPDHLVVVGHRAAEALRGAGVDPARVHVVGAAALDRLLPRRAPAPSPAASSTLLFMAEPPGGYASLRLERDERYRLDGWSRPHGRTETVLEEVILALDARAARGASPTRLIIRPHPKCPPSQFDAYRARVHSVDAGGPSWRAILAAHAVTGLTSAALDEAVVLERPALSIVPVPEESAWLRSADRGLIPSVSTRLELGAALDALLDAPRLPPNARVHSELALGGGERTATLLARLAACPSNPSRSAA